MTIPDQALQQHIAVLGKTGKGKTYAAKGVIVEPLLERGARVGIVDPTGAWWGLRSSRDGKGAGFPILVLGGDHGDLPLPALGGAAVARLLAEQGVNLVADTSQLTVGERTRWFIDFAGKLYRANSAPLHLVIDEAHNFAPQGKVPDPDTGKMLHAMNTLASGGRSRGDSPRDDHAAPAEAPQGRSHLGRHPHCPRHARAARPRCGGGLDQGVR